MASFSSRVKSELCRVSIKKRCCALSEIYGILLFCNTFTNTEIRIITKHRDFLERLPKLFAKAFSLRIEDVVEAKAGGVKSAVQISDREVIDKIFSCFGQDAQAHIAHHINLGVLEDECCRASFVRGAFLAGGSVTDPEKRYHLELVTTHYSVSRETYSIVLEMGFWPKIAIRGGSNINYFKQSEAIEDILTTLGAPVSAMEIMSAKVEKDMRNAVNRRVNCDTANADKIVSASQQQLEAIRKIDRMHGLGSLPDKLQETALLRVANPEASISELAQLANPPVSKSCLNHRLRKLVALSSEEERELQVN